ncbi:MAG: FHA domain-containing protein [Pyrinomonadaceae bacterium]
MIKCHSCGTDNLDGSQYCDECGSSLTAAYADETDAPPFRAVTAETPISGRSITSVGVPGFVDDSLSQPQDGDENGLQSPPLNRATLTIERGDSIGAEFLLSGNESNIGRWDADNGVFPDIDLDSHDHEAKVSRRHARIIQRDFKFFVEDLGSTNGTYINRGRRLLPGTPQQLADGDEIIVGKTFLRFHLGN